MINFLLAALLCAYSFSATASEIKTSPELEAPSASDLLFAHTLTSTGLIKRTETGVVREAIDMAAARVALSLIEDRAADVMVEKDGLSPWKIVKIQDDVGTHLKEVIFTSGKIWQKSLLKDRMTERGVSTVAKEAEIAQLRASLKQYRD